MRKSWVVYSHAVTLSLIAVAWSVLVVDAAELRLRKELVEQQANRALITVTATFQQVKNTVNSLDKDCDLHAPLRAEEIRVAVVGEFMNACSTGLAPVEVRKWTANGALKIEGVFRIWLEHPVRGVGPVELQRPTRS